MSEDLEDLLRRGLARAAGRHHPPPAEQAAGELLARRASGPGHRPTGSLVTRPRWQLASGGILAGALVAAALAALFTVGPSGPTTSPHGVAASRAPGPANAAVGAPLRAIRPSAPAVSPAAASGVGSAYGSGGAGSAAGGAAAEPAGAGKAPVAANSPTVTLTATDGGRTVSISRGRTIQLELSGDSLDWGEPRSGDPQILEETSNSSHPASGTAAASFLAIAPGRTTITAEGRPRCRHGSPCPQFVRVWAVTIDVSG